MQAGTKPKGVWVILVFCALSVVSTLRWVWRVYSDQLPTSDAAQYLESPSVLALAVTGLMLTIAFMVALFKMRRVAVTIFWIHIALAAVSLVWSILFMNYLSFFPALSLVEVAIVLASLAIPVQIYLYLRSLVREGALS